MSIIEHPDKRFMSKFDRFEPLVKDSTAMKVFKKCDRKFFYRIVLGFAPRKEKYQANMDWGTARHKFRETLELTNDIQSAMKAALGVKIAEPTDKYLFMTEKDRLMKMLATDYQMWEKEKEQGKIKVLEGSVEQGINVQMPDGTFSGGRVDQMIEWSGQVWDRDFKTSSKDLTYFSMEKDPDDQSTRYIYMLSKLHGKLIGGVVFDVIYNAKTVLNKVYKHIVTKTPKQLDMWEKDQLHLNRQLELDRKEDIWPMREGTCQFCEFVWVCRQNNEAAMMAKLESDYVRKPWNFMNVDQEEI